MSRLHDDWQVLPHGPVAEVDDGLFTVTGGIPMPLGNFPRRMTVARLAWGGTAIFSAIPLNEAGMGRIEALGAPAWLIVPNGGHRLDARPWKRRYPELKVLCPGGAREAVSQAVPVDATEDVLDDPEIRFVVLPGLGGFESALEVRRGGRLTLVTNDIIGNVRHPRGLGANIMARLTGFGVSRPRVPRVFKRFVTDPKAVAGQFRAWAEAPGLARILPSHGEAIADDPAGVLRGLADELAG